MGKIIAASVASVLFGCALFRRFASAEVLWQCHQTDIKLSSRRRIRSLFCLPITVFHPNASLFKDD